MGRAPCCEKDSVKRGPWTPEEDAKLLACIGQYGTGSWRTLPKKAGLQRCGKSCRLRWTNYLRPDLKHGRFSDQEEQLIVKLHAALGSRWSLIAAQLPGRTDNDVKNYWNTRLKKKLCEMGIDPITHKPISQLLADLAGSMTLPKGSEIAEATLGCFKDDMLNVLMRKRSDTLNNNMSFAPLTLPANQIISSANQPISSANQIISPSAPPSSSFNKNPNSPHLQEDSFPPPRGRCSTPSPCGPVGGIRSAAGSALAARTNHVINHTLNITNHSSSKPQITSVITPGFSAYFSPLYHSPSTGQFHAGGLNDPSSCMLDILLDQTSYGDMKEVPDLNLMNDQMQTTISRQASAGAGHEIPAGATADHHNPAASAGITDQEALPEYSMHAGTAQRRRLYTGLLQQQEKARSSCSMSVNDKQRSLIHAGSHGVDHRKGAAAGQEEDQCKVDNLGGHGMVGSVGAGHTMEDGMQWSPVSYTNSGSSSSNLSLSVNPLPEQHHISPIDSVLTSDALLWDLSELGSMVS